MIHIDKLVILKNNNAVCDSLQVADKFNKRHDKLVFEIERMYGELVGERFAQNGGHPLFYKTTYKHEQNGQIYNKYLMTRDGFSLLVMGFTGKKALEWKLNYIKAFNSMENILRQRNTNEWIDTRNISKLMHKTETDTIKELVEYAKQQGSKHADKLYITYASLIKRVTGVLDRDLTSISQLNNLNLVVNIILKSINSGMNENKFYKDIYQDCKTKIEMLNSLVDLIA